MTGEPSQGPPLLPVNGCGSSRHLAAGASLDLDKAEHFSLPRDQVDIARDWTVIPSLGDDLKPIAPQKKERGLFAALSGDQMSWQFMLIAALCGQPVEAGYAVFEDCDSGLGMHGWFASGANAPLLAGGFITG
jgi:hypothetical protein